MASKRDRQRKLERARTERRLARQAASTRRRRQTQASVAVSLALVLIVFGVVWLAGGFESTPEPTPTAAAGTCTWNLLEPDPVEYIYDTGRPAVTGERRTGTETMTIATDLGTIEAELDLAKAPCTAASFGFLAGQRFFDGSTCHRLTTEGIYVLQCGDPSGSGRGGPSYRFADENLPAATGSGSASPPASAAPAENLYPKGTLAMANSGPGTNGSQFFIVYADGSDLGPDYTIFGKIVKGLDIVERVARDGAVDESGKPVADGKPKTAVRIQSITVGEAPTAPPSTPTSTPSPGGTAGPTP